MKVSIVTVSFNSAKTIADTLDSISAQTHPNIEHIVIDGGSTDDTLAIVALKGLPTLKLISEADRGIYDAMNKGLRTASGDIVGFLNADDTYAHPDAVALIVKAIGNNPEALAAYGDMVYVRQNSETTVLRYWRSGAFAKSRLKFGWMPPHPTFYLRTNCLPKVGLFDDTLRIAADYDFMLRVLSQDKASAVHIPNILVRMKTGGVSNRSLSSIIRKSREDLIAIRKNQIGGLFTLLCKNFRKVPQWLIKLSIP